MSKHDRSWEDRLAESPFDSSRFTEELKENVRSRVKGHTGRRSFMLPAALLGAVAFIGLVVFYAMDGSSLLGRGEPIEPRQAYYRDGQLLVEAFPDPGLKAGVPYGYMFHFTAPFEELKGKMLFLEAVHLSTGERTKAVEPFVVESPSSGYEGLERWTTSFALPLPGMWQFDFTLDGEHYANVVLKVAEPDWSLTPIFQGETYKLRGIPDVIGFIDPGFIANHYNKYMWFFLDRNLAQGGNFEVKAVREGSDKLLSILEYGPAGSYDRLPSSMMLPEPGKWRLLPYMNGKLIGSIVVEVAK